MTIPHIKFNLDTIHYHQEALLRYDQHVTTTRTERRCREGQIVFLEGFGYAVCVMARKYSGTLYNFSRIVDDYYQEEGFKTKDEFAKALVNIYKTIDREWYVYRFRLLVDHDGNILTTLPKEEE